MSLGLLNILVLAYAASYDFLRCEDAANTLPSEAYTYGIHWRGTEAVCQIHEGGTDALLIRFRIYDATPTLIISSLTLLMIGIAIYSWWRDRPSQ